jgi:hypothetical protein
MEAGANENAQGLNDFVNFRAPGERGAQRDWKRR